MSAGVDHRPTQFGSRLALLAGVVPVVVGALAGPRPAGLALLALLATWVGLRRASRRPVTAGATLALAALFLAGLAGVGAGPLLAGVAASVGGWDVARNAIDLGDQVGRDAPGGGVERRHAAVTAAVAVLSVAVGYAVFSGGVTAAPLTALVLLALAALLVTAALD